MKRLLCSLLAALMLCGCTAAPAQTTAPAGPQLKPGCYVLASEDYASTMLYIQLSEDGTGCVSLLGVAQELTWTPEGAVFGEMTITPCQGGLMADTEKFTYTGEGLPEGYLPDPPVPGFYAVSSVGLDGDVEFYGALSRDNGYFELREDGAGTLVFDDVEYPFTLDGITARFDGWSVMLLDMSDQDPEGATMVMVYVMDGPLKADSIVFHKLEE